MTRHRHREHARPSVHRSSEMTPDQIIEAMVWAGFTAHEIALLLVSLGYRSPR